MKIFGLLLIIVFVLIAVSNISDKYAARRDAQAQEQAHTQLVETLKNHKAELFESAKKLAQSGDYDKAIKSLDTYANLGDHDVGALMDTLEAEQLRKQLSALRPNQHEERVALLEKIALAQPQDAGVAADLKKEHAILDHEQAIFSARIERLNRINFYDFCNELRAHPKDGGYTASFESRGGRQGFLQGVLDNHVEIGMNEFEAVCAWGYPERTNRTVGVGYEDKQIVFGAGYVYLRNGVVTSFQTTN